jgi:hypothetical protein
MQSRQTTSESGGNGSAGTQAAMRQGGQDADAATGDTWPPTMEQTFTYALNPSLQFEITVSVKPVAPPSAALIGGAGPRPK